MRHHLIPPIILEYYAAGQRSGRFDAVCLFVDTSGFTPLTTAMMAHGAEGAETVANTLSAVFSPLVRVVTVFINLKDMPDDAGFADTLFPLLAQYEGYLCRIGRIGERDRGATLLLFWGAPLSHENDLARALGFLLELRQAQPGLVLRAGATMGLAYAGYIGSEQREEYTCHGATVNLAARLMVTATWGNVWLDEETAHLAQAQFDLDPVGWHHLKGINAAQTLYRLAGRRETGKAAFFRGEMVGR